MEIKNLEKLPEKTQNILKPFIEGLFSVSGDNIVSIYAYGSVTGADYNPKTSDINIVVILKDASLAKLKPMLKTVKSGLRKKIITPLFITNEYIKMSLDTFPMEFSAIRDSRCLLSGEDILSEIEVKREDLRRECEYQLKGKILTIRQAYLEQALSRKGIEALIKNAFRALMPVFQGVLRLKREETPPLGKEELLRELGREFDLNTGSFLEVLKDEKADGRIGGESAEVFLSDFLVQLEKLSECVDQI